MLLSKPFFAIIVSQVLLLLILLSPDLPAQTGEEWNNLGPSGGNIRGLTADYKNPGTLFAGTATGEIYKTTDDGQNWFYLNSVGKPVRHILIDTVSGNYLYVFARHEADGISPQVFVSGNSGQTWSSSYSMDFGNVLDAMIVPPNTTQLYAISGTKIVRSMNQGASWSPIRQAGDSIEFTAMAINPQDPFNNFYVSYSRNNGTSVIQRTSDAGYNYSTKLILPQQWRVGKLFVSNNSSSTVFAMIGKADSTLIIYSDNNGTSWNIAFEAQIPMTLEFETIRWLVFPDQKTFVVPAANKIFKSHNGGVTWNEITQNDPKEETISYLERAPADTAKFYGHLEGLTYKFIQGSSGSLGTVVINKGLTAGQISKIHFTDNEKIVAQWQNNLIFSLNQGLDYEVLQTNTTPYGAFWSNRTQKFIWVEERGKVYRTSDGRNKDSLPNPIYSPFIGIVTNAFSMNYYTGNGDSTVMLASVSSPDPDKNGLWMSVDDGANWININHNSGFGTSTVKSFSAYLTFINTIPRLRIIAARSDSIFAMLKGGSSWNGIFGMTAPESIKQISSNKNTVLISATTPSSNGLWLSRLDNAAWEPFNITASVDSLFQVNGPGRIVDVSSADDGNYMILEHYGDFESTKRKLYKIGYNPSSVRWVEITEPPVDLFLFNSIGASYSVSDKSFNVYAAANNGIWKLKQTPVITHDSLIAAPAAEVLTDETSFSVMYYNQGSAFAYIDSFILRDAEGHFSFAYPEDATEGLFLDIKTGTPLEMKFHPQSTGNKQAILEAHLLTRSSSGFGDSTIILKTRLTGNVKYSQIGTGLKGDTLNLGATMLGTSLTKTFNLKNTGTTDLYIHGMAVLSGEPVFLLNMDTTEFVLQVNESRTVPIVFEAGLRDTLWKGELWVYSSAYNVQQGHPDSLRKITLTARASGMNWIQSDDPVLNQPYTLEVYLTDMKNSTANAVLKYWPIGSPSTAIKSKNLTQTPYPDNHLHLSVTLPAEDITEKGIQFYVEISDGSFIIFFPDKGDRYPHYLNVKIPSPGLNSSSWQTLPGGTSRQAYRLVSFPLELKEKTPLGAFGTSNLGELGDKGGWQLLRWDRLSNRFIKASDVSPSFGSIYNGRSYLLITRETKSLNSGEGTTVNPDEALTAILPGWNMIANPYAFPIYWPSVVKNNPDINFRNLVVLNEGRFEYVKDKDIPLFRLEPWKGYLYYSDTTTFLIHYPASEAGLFAKTAFSSHPPRYSVYFSLQDEKNNPLGTVELGESQSASGGYDMMDRPALPSLGADDPQIHLLAWDGKKLQTDYRAISENGSVWDLEILNTSQTHNPILIFDEAVNLPSGFQIAVIELSSVRTEFVTPGQSVTLFGNKNKPIRYKMIAGSREFIEAEMKTLIPSDFYLARNFPNPFNPATTLHYGLPTRSKTEIAIYNALGQKVRALFSGTQNAGQYRISWDGRNDNGIPAASGVYIYRITARSTDDGRTFRQNRKMMLIK